MNYFLNKHEPIYETKGNLPHWTQYGKITFVTFRLADSLPQYIIDNIKTEYESIKQQLLKEGNLKELEFLKVKKHNQLEKNHIHLLIEPKEQATIQQIIKTIKSVSAHKINSYINQTGSIWQKEYFDRIIRNEDHYNRVINYIRQNPSHCSPSEYILWERGRHRPPIKQTNPLGEGTPSSPDKANKLSNYSGTRASPLLFIRYILFLEFRLWLWMFCRISNYHHVEWNKIARQRQCFAYCLATLF